MTVEEAAELMELYEDLFQAGYSYAISQEDPPHHVTVHWAMTRIVELTGLQETVPSPDTVAYMMKGQR